MQNFLFFEIKVLKTNSCFHFHFNNIYIFEILLHLFFFFVCLFVYITVILKFYLSLNNEIFNKK